MNPTSTSSALAHLTSHTSHLFCCRKSQQASPLLQKEGLRDKVSISTVPENMKSISGVSICVLLASLFQAYAFAPSHTIAKTNTIQQSLVTYRATPQHDMEHDSESSKKSFMSRFERNPLSKSTGRRKRLRKKATTIAASLAIYSTILLRTPQPAMANHPLQNVPTGKVSLRPGMSIVDMESEAERRTALTIDEQIASQHESKASTSTGAKPKKSNKKQKVEFDLDEEYEFDDEDEEDANVGIAKVGGAASSKTLDIEANSSAKAVSRFSGSGPAMSEETKDKEIGRTVVKIVGPIFAFCFARETLRWNREQKNVDKGIEIMEEQRKEYMNAKKDDDDDDDDDVSFL